MLVPAPDIPDRYAGVLHQRFKPDALTIFAEPSIRLKMRTEMSRTNNASLSCDVLISGGGVPGLVLAGFLGQAGLSVVVIDPQKPVHPDTAGQDSRTSALMDSSLNILESLGVWTACRPYATPLQTLRIIQESSRLSPGGQTDFHSGDIGLPQFGMNIRNIDLRFILSEFIANINSVVFLTPVEMTGFTADDIGVSATLSDGQHIRSRFLVGADGRASKTRNLCNIPVREHDYGQSAITCMIDHSKPHDFISTEFHRPGGPMTLVPMAGNRSSVVWVESTRDSEKFMAFRKGDFESALQSRTKNLLGRIHLASTPQSWPLKAMTAKKMTAPRIALVAEAAHILHPLGAQGLNLSLRDVATLAEEITDAARSGIDIGSRSILDQYEFRRRADVTTRSLTTFGLNRLVSNDMVILRALRLAGQKTLEELSPLRKIAMQEGVTAGYDDSRLMRGLPL